MAKIEIGQKYGFPLFTKDVSTDYILKNKRIRVSDLWSFWNYIIRMYKQHTAGVNKDFLLSLLEQARYFYQVAENAPINSQPLLYYYSFLNLAKIAININSYLGDSVRYYHGVECPITSTTTIDNAELSIKELDPARKIYSVDFELMKIMGDVFSPPAPHRLKIIDALKACVGIHRTYCEITNEKEIYYKLSSPTLYRDGMELIFESEIKNCDIGIYQSLQHKGYSISPTQNRLYILSEKFRMSHYTPNRNDYFALSNILIRKGIWSYTDGNEYRMYITDGSIRYSSASVIYNLMFFFGSITRYHPFLFEKLLSEKNLWMISEFLKTQPMQFLHLVTSRTIGATLLKPRTSNIINCI